MKKKLILSVWFALLTTSMFSQQYFKPNPSVEIEEKRVNTFLSQIPEIEQKAVYYNLSKSVLQTILVLQSNAGLSVADRMHNYGRVVMNSRLSKYEVFNFATDEFIVCNTSSRGVEATALCLHFLRKSEKKSLTDAKWLTLVFGPDGDLHSLASEANNIYKSLTGQSFKDLGLKFGDESLKENPPLAEKMTEKPAAPTKHGKVEAKSALAENKSAEVKQTASQVVDRTENAVQKSSTLLKETPDTKPQMTTQTNDLASVKSAPSQEQRTESQSKTPQSAISPAPSTQTSNTEKELTRQNAETEKPIQPLQTIMENSSSPTVEPLNLQKTSAIVEVQKSDYNRSSFTILQTVTPGVPNLPHFRTVTRDGGTLAARFDWNHIPIYEFPLDPSGINTLESVKAKVNNSNIGRELIAYWFNRQSDGSFNSKLIAERGKYNASDLDKRLADNSPRNISELEDAGYNLINNSYVVLMEVKSFQTMEQYYDEQDASARAAARENPEIKYKPVTRNERGYIGKVTGYLFKLNFSDTVRQALYDIWLQSEDTPEQRKEKIAAFDKFYAPMIYVDKYSSALFPIKGTVMKENPDDTKKNEQGIDLLGDLAKALKGSPKTDADLMRLFEHNAVEKIFHNLVLKGGIQKSVEVTSSLYKVEPLQAKIGKKEGVHPEKRFFVYEKKEKANGEIVYIRKGVLRAKNLVTDNTYQGTGDMRPTEFFRVGGTGQLEEGMLLKEKTETGLSVAALVGFNGKTRYGGVNLEYNISYLLGKSMGSGVPVGFKLGASWTEEKLEVAENEWDRENYTFNHFNFYLKKDLAIASIFRLGLFSGLSFETGTNEADESESYQGSFIPAGADFGINVFPWLHAFVQAEYGFQLGEAALNGDQNTPVSEKWYDLYPDRKRIHTRLGLRLSF